MSNHKNESCLRSYKRSLSSNQKKSLSSTLLSMASASRLDENKAFKLMPIPGSYNVETPCQVPRDVDLTSNQPNTENYFFSILKVKRLLTSDRITTLFIMPTLINISLTLIFAIINY